MHNSHSNLYIGLMSGTSMDGVDGVLVELPTDGSEMRVLVSRHLPFPENLRMEAMALQQPGDNEIVREANLAYALAENYAQCVAEILSFMPNAKVRAIGVHGQTIRHRPELGFTRQTNNPALLAELSGIDVIADFRSRDVAAGGQGAPLVPAFHRDIFGVAGECRVVVNIGGMSNISILHADGHTSGFDTGPGNVLMDAWIAQHQHKAYDESGTWAEQGNVNEALLAHLCDEAFFRLTPPKSTGRDLFSPLWLKSKLSKFIHLDPVDVQATLCAYTANTIADAIHQYAVDANAAFICGGGAYNLTLLNSLRQAFAKHGMTINVASTSTLGIFPNQVEALAFAWLAQRFTLRLPGNLPEVTGAVGLRILGALYPA